MGGPGERKERKSKREKKGKERKQSLSNHSKWGGKGGGGLFTAFPLLRGGGGLINQWSTLGFRDMFMPSRHLEPVSLKDPESLPNMISWD